MLSFPAALIGCFVFVTLLWLFSEKIKNASIIDAVWSLMIAVPAAFYLLNVTPWSARKGLILFMVSVWGFRLSWHIGRRLLHEKREDARYTGLREKWGAEQSFQMLRFFWIQAASAVFLSIPFLWIAVYDGGQIRLFEIAGFLIWLFAIAGETTADHQLERFKKDPANKGKTCRVGWWNYSRHPNYFFEWLIWVSYFIFALGSAYGMATVLFPALMFYVLREKTGIPLAEKQSLISRGESYRQYQREVNAFFPWFSKGGA